MEQMNIQDAALDLAISSAESDPTIRKIYWFPNDQQVRLLHIDSESIKTDDQDARPFYFNKVEGIPFTVGLAMLHPDEERLKAPPVEWASDWSDAKIIYQRNTQPV